MIAFSSKLWPRVARLFMCHFIFIGLTVSTSAQAVQSKKNAFPGFLSGSTNTNLVVNTSRDTRVLQIPTGGGAPPCRVSHVRCSGDRRFIRSFCKGGWKLLPGGGRGDFCLSCIFNLFLLGRMGKTLSKSTRGRNEIEMKVRVI